MDDVEAAPVSEVKTALADVLQRLDGTGVLALTRHDKRCAVLLSPEAYDELVRRAGDPLEKLADQFDAMIATMQGAGTDAAVEELFGVPPRSESPAARARRARHG